MKTFLMTILGLFLPKPKDIAQTVAKEVAETALEAALKKLRR